MDPHVVPMMRQSRPPWTNEKHVQFLNNMEASFVRAMFQKKDRRPPRLDRFIPDTSDSTLDLKLHKTKNLKSQGRRMDGGSEKRSRRFLSQPFNSSQDQVVPRFEIRSVDDKDEQDHPNVPAFK